MDECVRNDTDDTGCVSLISVMPGIWASVYALPLLSFNGAGGILYGGVSVFNVDFNDNFVNATDKLCTGPLLFTDDLDSTPAENTNKTNIKSGKKLNTTWTIAQKIQIDLNNQYENFVFRV